MKVQRDLTGDQLSSLWKILGSSKASAVYVKVPRALYSRLLLEHRRYMNAVAKANLLVEQETTLPK